MANTSTAEELTAEVEQVMTGEQQAKLMQEDLTDTPPRVREHYKEKMTADKKGQMGESTSIASEKHPSHRKLFSNNGGGEEEDRKNKGGGFLEFFGLAGGRRRRRRKKSRKKKKSK